MVLDPGRSDYDGGWCMNNIPLVPLTGGTWLAVDPQSRRPLLGRNGCFGALAAYHDAFAPKRMLVELWLTDLGQWLSHNSQHSDRFVVQAAQSQLAILSGLTTSKLPRTVVTVVETEAA